MTNGIVIVALGYDLYAYCAYNLALSLKAYDSHIRVCLLHDGDTIKSLSKKELSLFDDMVLIPEKEYKVANSFQYQRVKLCVYKYSPYDFTCYMDADNIWMPEKKPSWFMGDIIHHDFRIGMNGQYDYEINRATKNNYTFWGDAKKICQYYKIKEILPQSVSGYFSFHKCEKVEELFKRALSIYDEKGSPTITWAGGKADEFCFNVAMAQMGMAQEEFHVFYFAKLNGKIPPEAIYKKFWGMAVGGNRVSDSLVIIYNRLVNKYSIIKEMQTRHYHVNKVEVIPERKAF